MKRRSSVINDLQDDLEGENGKKMTLKESPMDYYIITDTYSIPNRWINTDRHIVKFQFKRLDLAKDPEGVFAECMGRAIIEAGKKAEEAYQCKPDRMGIEIFSDKLDYPIWIPFQRTQGDRSSPNKAVEPIINRIERINQSLRRGSLYGAPFEMSITTICDKALTAKIKSALKLPGKGRKKIKMIIKHSEARAGIKEVNNYDDNWCLFHACEISRMRAMAADDHNAIKRLHKYRSDADRQRRNVLQLLRKTKIPEDLPVYDADKYLPVIHAYYEQIYSPKKFRINVFTKYGRFNPEFKVGQLEDDPVILDLYLNYEHFDVISSLPRFFDKPRKRYCYWCEATYDKDRNHDMSCKALCLRCRQHGKGPCQPNTEEKKCFSCNQLFNNKECMELHEKNGTCGRFQRCTKCGVIWNREEMERKKRGFHVCNHRFCSKCKTYHDRARGCYITVPKPEKKEAYRIM